MDRRSSQSKMEKKQDRRQGSDRRTAERFRLELPVEWEGTSGRLSGTLGDLSPIGCFILCSGDVVDGDQVRVDIPLNSGGSLSLWGEVTNHVPEIGFGIRFVALTETQRTYLDRLIDTLQND
jgi:PilZ domain